MIFDASSIYALVRAKRFDLLKEGTTLDLARYELGNAVWKDAILFNEITPEEGIAVLKLITEAINLLQIVDIDGEEVKVLELACEKAFPFYDAAYVHLASKRKEPLITEDRKLRQATSSIIKTFSMADL